VSDKKILLVEDDLELVKLLTIRLEGNGYRVVSAADGKEGFKKAHSEKPDILILDLGLPKVDGYWVCEFLKKDPKFSKMRVLVLTARAGEDDKKLAEQCGADAYMVKPFDAEELLGKIESLCR